VWEYLYPSFYFCNDFSIGRAWKWYAELLLCFGSNISFFWSVRFCSKKGGRLRDILVKILKSSCNAGKKSELSGDGAKIVLRKFGEFYGSKGLVDEFVL